MWNFLKEIFSAMFGPPSDIIHENPKPTTLPPEPMTPKDILDPKELFFATYAPYAKASMKKTKIPASVTLAQAALESAWGKSAPGNNFFGVKAGKSWSGATQLLWTWEEIGGKRVRIQAKFRKYPTPEDSFDDHGAVIAGSRYLKHAMEHTESAEAFIHALQSRTSKYATDSKYEQKIMKIIKDFDLERFDREE